jgi:MarR family transcriptional regulator, transcriptional regulator for hemolysin
MLEFDLINAGRLYARCFHERYRQLNLTHCRALLALAQNQGMTQSGLGRLIAFDSVALGRILDRLEASSWIKRQAYPGDRRAHSLVLTEEARELLPALWSAVAELERDALRGVSAGEKQILMSALQRMLGNLRQYAGALE